MAPSSYEGVRVTGFEMKDGRIIAVQTNQGDIACDKVVNCGGQWARQIGAMAGINVPLQPVKHQYIITEKIDGPVDRRADHPRSRPAHLFQGRGRRPGDGRL